MKFSENVKMAGTDVTKKVAYIGQWHEDVFTDELVSNIAAFATAQKGKKLKMRLNPVGLKLTRSRFLQESKTTIFPIKDIKTVTKNPGFTSCIMFILADPNKKYRIIALRTTSDTDASHVANVFAEIKKGQQTSNIELKKRDNGNWTLRERSAHNANRHLAEIFNERKQSNGTAAGKPNGDVSHVVVVDDSKAHTNGNHTKGVYIKRGNVKVIKDDDDDDDYVIETEVASYPYSSGATSRQVKELEAQEREMKEIKSALQTASTNDYPDGSPTNKYPPSHSGPELITATSHRPAIPEIVVYKASPRPHESQVSTSSAGYYTNPWAAHRRVSGSVMVPTRINPDQISIRSNSSRISRSHKWRLSEYTMPTTIERPIEETYARPLIIRRVGGHLIAQKARPVTYHPMVTYEPRVFYAEGRHLDVAL